MPARVPAAPSPVAVPPAKPGGSLRRNIFLLAALLLLGYCGISGHWSVYELGRCLLGLVLLWGPVGALLYVLLRRPVTDPTVRLAFSCAGSYSLTTLLYFVAAVMGAQWLFGAILLLASAAAVWLGGRLLRAHSIDLPRMDAVLLTIVAGSLVTTLPYNTAITLKPSGDRILTGFPDHYYHAGLSYELSRHVPPSQATIRGGTPERAYHMFPHLTTMLIARFTGQPEMMRAHGVYHYAAITVLICLALYGIGFLLTATVTGGYVGAFLPFLFAIPMRPILPNQLGYFFFTVLPHATSTIFPTMATSPQMYSGIAAIYGVLLGIAALTRMPPAERGGHATLPVVCGLMVGTLLRFRIHCWIATLPVFLIFVFVMWFRSRRTAWLISGVTAIVVSALLYREMSLPIYMRNTAELHFALSRLSTNGYYRVWPFSSSIEQQLHNVLSGTLLDWTWEIVCLTGFAVWDILGIPLCIALVLVPAIMKRSQAIGYYLFTIGIILVSMVLATCLTMQYDRYSVPGQFAYHFGWYALPLGGVAVTWLVLYMQRRSRHAEMLWIVIAVISGIGSAVMQNQLVRVREWTTVITPAGWDAFHYLKESTPENAIVLSSSDWDRKLALVSGLGGRSSYLDMAPNPVDDQALRLNPSDNRSFALGAMAAARDPATLCSVITSTPITHILEEASNPLMPNLPCLKRQWTGRDGVTAVWQVIHR